MKTLLISSAIVSAFAFSALQVNAQAVTPAATPAVAPAAVAATPAPATGKIIKKKLVTAGAAKATTTGVNTGTTGDNDGAEGGQGGEGGEGGEGAGGDND